MDSLRTCKLLPSCYNLCPKRAYDSFQLLLDLLVRQNQFDSHLFCLCMLFIHSVSTLLHYLLLIVMYFLYLKLAYIPVKILTTFWMFPYLESQGSFYYIFLSIRIQHTNPCKFHTTTQISFLYQSLSWRHLNRLGTCLRTITWHLHRMPTYKQLFSKKFS